mmetsp:Transcript_45087/g.32955  ORF Transcript_45087/g.32955 Transcript_45087/m.32955 type:complete len:87 (+) Transcript_45087:429-689(+)
MLRERLLEAKFKNVKTGESVEGNFWVIFRYLFEHELWFAFVTLLCGLMVVMLSLFFLYHFLFAISNSTTSERAKRSDMKAFYIPKE